MLARKQRVCALKCCQTLTLADKGRGEEWLHGDLGTFRKGTGNADTKAPCPAEAQLRTPCFHSGLAHCDYYSTDTPVERLYSTPNPALSPAETLGVWGTAPGTVRLLQEAPRATGRLKEPAYIHLLIHSCGHGDLLTPAVGQALHQALGIKQ